MPQRRSRPAAPTLEAGVKERMRRLYADLLARYYLEREETLSYRAFSQLVEEEHPEGRRYDASTVLTWIKRGKRPDDAETQQAIARIFGVSPGWLWFGSGPERDIPLPTTEGVVIGRSRGAKGRRKSA